MLHFTPTSSSWLNLVERWFAELTTKKLVTLAVNPAPDARWGEMLLLVIVGLVVLGAERLPGAIQWTAAIVRRARGYLTGATPSFDRGRPNHQPYRHIVRCRICPHSGKVVLIPGSAR